MRFDELMRSSRFTNSAEAVLIRTANRIRLTCGAELLLTWIICAFHRFLREFP